MGQKAAIYCRVSTSDQSCARQEWELLEYARKSGFEVAGIWKETVSGSKDQRPERKKVLALAKKRQIDVILVTECESASKVDPDRRSIMTQLSTRYQMLTRIRWVK